MALLESGNWRGNSTPRGEPRSYEASHSALTALLSGSAMVWSAMGHGRGQQGVQSDAQEEARHRAHASRARAGQREGRRRATAGQVSTAAPLWSPADGGTRAGVGPLA